ncbi:hypothetical protein GEMRC1_009697 [Eukaryota sp. GEM-RC1]
MPRFSDLLAATTAKPSPTETSSLPQTEHSPPEPTARVEEEDSLEDQVIVIPPESLSAAPTRTLPPPPRQPAEESSPEPTLAEPLIDAVRPTRPVPLAPPVRNSGSRGRGGRGGRGGHDNAVPRMPGPTQARPLRIRAHVVNGILCIPESGIDKKVPLNMISTRADGTYVVELSVVMTLEHHHSDRNPPPMDPTIYRHEDWQGAMQASRFQSHILRQNPGNPENPEDGE